MLQCQGEFGQHLASIFINLNFISYKEKFEVVLDYLINQLLIGSPLRLAGRYDISLRWSRARPLEREGTFNRLTGSK